MWFKLTRKLTFAPKLTAHEKTYIYYNARVNCRRRFGAGYS